MMIQEQGTDGSGRSISGTVAGYEGYYNYLNIGAYKTDRFSSAVVRGLWYASGGDNGGTSYRRPWNNAADSITGGAIYYGEGFVKVGQDTLYLKKFNVRGSNLYGHQYMTSVQGAASEGKHLAKAYDENARKSALVFKIPVFKNMPANPCPRPTGDGDPNYMLKSLSISGQSLTPTFSMYETSYSLIVSNEVTSVTIAAQALASTTTVSGAGTHNLNVGQNTLQVVTKAQSGATRTYTINVVRQEPVVTPPSPEPETPPVVTPTPEIDTTAYQVSSDKVITGLTDFKTLTVATFKDKFSVSNGTIQVTTTSGTVKNGSLKVGTGDQIRVYDNEGVLKYTYTIVIYGDTNGDGDISALDLLRVQKDILNISKLSGCYQSAADTNKKDGITVLDLLQVQKELLGLPTIKQ
jgi:beta-N-acetylglucosaminidase